MDKECAISCLQKIRTAATKFAAQTPEISANELEASNEDITFGKISVILFSG
jgi:hypothetical protein